MLPVSAISKMRVREVEGRGGDLNNLEYMLVHSCWSGLAIFVMTFLRTATLLTMTVPQKFSQAVGMEEAARYIVGGSRS